MLRNSLSVFFRKLLKRDIYALINLFGLGTGIAACLIIFLFVRDELSYDRFHEHAQDTYRVLLHNPRTGKAMAALPGVMYPYIHDQLPGVDKIGRMFHYYTGTFNTGEEPMHETGLWMADEEMLDIFSLQFVAGDPSTSLANPHSIILTEAAAAKYFGQENPLGKSLLFENQYSFVVSGIIKDLPAQSHLSFSMLASIESLHSLIPSILDNWHNQGVFIYMKLKKGIDPDQVAEQITQIALGANESLSKEVYFPLQPMLDIRLHSGDIELDVAGKSDITLVMIFSVIAVLILVLACFNFINLSVAMAVRRAREIGIRKVLGAGRSGLIGQYMAETFVMVCFALLLALLLMELILPSLNNLTGKALSLNLFTDPLVLVFIIALLLIISLLAGSYPSIVVSRFKAISAMRGDQQQVTSIGGFGKKRYQFRMRQLLMLLQFAVSTALIVASLLIFLQMQFLSKRHPGYQKEGLINISNQYDEQAPARALWLKNQLKQHPDITGISLSHNTPPVMPNNYASFSYEGTDGTQRIHAALISCDANFFPTLGSKIARGRDFDENLGTDQISSAIINTTAAARMGMDDPIGEILRGFYDNQPRQIIGVVEDIHFSSMHEQVEPMVFFISESVYPWNWFNILIRYKEGSARQVLDRLEVLWQEDSPQWPLRYHFVEEQFLAHYDEDRRTMYIVASFAVLAVLLSVLGLIGLALYASTARTKEIGIRKVLGAKVSEIIRMITSEFGVLVIISNLLAWPAAYLFINRWLDNFAYRIDINWLAFLIPALLVYLVAAITVGMISYRAAMADPVVTLKNNE
jgi:putative ABC transport system permease protein